jgi:hypothetical protein
MRLKKGKRKPFVIHIKNKYHIRRKVTKILTWAPDNTKFTENKSTILQ